MDANNRFLRMFSRAFIGYRSEYISAEVCTQRDAAMARYKNHANLRRLKTCLNIYFGTALHYYEAFGVLPETEEIIYRMGLV